MTEYGVRRIPGEGELSHAFDVRQDVFVDEQDVSEAEEWDGLDDDAIHYVLYDGGRPVGTARLRMPESGLAKVERVAVRSEHRGEGLGRRLMDLLESEARKQGCSRVLLYAQVPVEEFYEKLGYETTSDVFDEAGIPHVEMEKPLD